MKTNAAQQEILLMTNNSFAQMQWCKKDNEEHKNLTPEENMEELCVNGLIQEILPEIFNTNDKSYLWQMLPGFSFLQLQFGEYPAKIEKAFSLDPHNFLSAFQYN